MWNEEVYKTYRPYPVTWNLKQDSYSTEAIDNAEPKSTNRNGTPVSQDFHDLIGDPTPSAWFSQKPLSSNSERPLRPLRLLQSLFSDRLTFLQNALDEVEKTKSERERLTHDALSELDAGIEECELRLRTIKAAFNNHETQHKLEQRLFNLKREYHHHSIMCWRDIVVLKDSIRKLKREIETLSRTTESAENREAPT